MAVPPWGGRTCCQLKPSRTLFERGRPCTEDGIVLVTYHPTTLRSRRLWSAFKLCRHGDTGPVMHSQSGRRFRSERTPTLEMESEHG